VAKKVYITEFDANGKPYYRTLSEMEDKTLKSTKKIDESFKKIGAGIATYFGGREILQFALDSVQLASKLQGVKGAFNQLKNSTRILEDLRKATRGTVSEFTLMQAAVKADNFKIPLNLLTKGLEFANKRAIQTGDSIDYLVDSFITGVARKSIPILDNLGISQVALNKEIEKTGDFYAAIGNIVTQENEKMSGSINTATEAFQRLNATIENNKAALGEKLLPVWGNFLGITNELLSDLSELGNLLSGNFASAYSKAVIRQNSYGGNSTGGPGTSLLSQLGIYGQITPGMYVPTQTTTTNKITGSKTPKNIKDWVSAQSNPSFLSGYAGGAMPGGPNEGLDIISQDNIDETLQELEDTFVSVGDSFVNKFSETQNIANQVGRIFNVSADSFVGKLMQAFDVGSSILSIVGSIMNIGSGGITSLFGLAKGGTVINKHGQLSYAPIPKFARGGSFMVPPGYANDSGLMRVQSGERVDVTPSNQVPMLGKALGEIKSAIMAGNMNNSRKGSQPIVVYNMMDGQVVSKNVIRNQNRLTKAGQSFEDFD